VADGLEVIGSWTGSKKAYSKAADINWYLQWREEFSAHDNREEIKVT
jgi:hypothetical protein